MHHEASVLVRDSLSRLGEIDREVLTLFFFEAFRRDEVAHILGIASNAVSARLLRATNRLASELKRSHADWCHVSTPPLLKRS
ncbi:sigma factor-like helix-turn-helix DNA-binding protein [Isosphaeraceae bacterium EP7]